MNFSSNGITLTFNIEIDVFAAAVADAIADKVYRDVKATVSAPLNAGRKAREAFNTWVDASSAKAEEVIEEVKEVAHDTVAQTVGMSAAVATATKVKVTNRAVAAITPIIAMARKAQARVNAIRASYREAIAAYCDISEVGVIAHEVPTVRDGSIISSAGITTIELEVKVG